MEKFKVAVIQNSAGPDEAQNLQNIEELLAGAGPADLVALPEIFSLRGNDERCRAASTMLNSHTAVGHARNWCSEYGCCILLGSLIEREGDRIYNTSVLLNRKGEITAAYRKIHLFSAELKDGTIVRESDMYTPGDEPVICDLEGWKCGLSICYDLRFPELFRAYSQTGADLIFAPSNFTAATGKDHWEVLVRARAIENQCWMVAPNQCGENPDTGVKSYGHSMIVDPWGKIAAKAGTEPCVIKAELDPAAIQDVRKRLPALKHRRM